MTTDQLAFQDTHEEHRITCLIEAVLVYPTWYTLNGALEEVGTYLQGFYSGALAHSPKSFHLQEAQDWFEFCTWAANRLSNDADTALIRLFQALRKAHTDDTSALKRLLALYQEYQRLRRTGALP